MTSISRHLILRPIGVPGWWSLQDRHTGERHTFAAQVRDALLLVARMGQRMERGETFTTAYWRAINEQELAR